jgi:ubiquinone/menaquinone biosynthesis C-methylase UbiE
VTDAMLVEAKKLAKARGLVNFRTARARAEDLPFPDMSFDLVTCRLAAHHFENTGAFEHLIPRFSFRASRGYQQ